MADKPWVFGTAPPSAGPDYDNLGTYAKAQVDQFVNDFGTLIDWPGDYSPNNAREDLAKQRLFNLEEAYAYLYSKLTPDEQQHNPWAQFGLNENQFHDKSAQLKSTYYDYTGQDLSGDLLSQAIRERWTNDDIKRHVAADPNLGTFAAAGDTYVHAREAFITTYGQAPADINVLKGWWNFQRQAKLVGTGAEASRTPTQLPSQPTPRPGAESEVR